MAVQATGPTGGPITLTLDVLEPWSNNSSNASSVFGVRLTPTHFIEKAVTLGSTGRGRVESGEVDVGRTLQNFRRSGVPITVKLTDSEMHVAWQGHTFCTIAC
jgi:hypothetical protein